MQDPIEYLYITRRLDPIWQHINLSPHLWLVTSVMTPQHKMNMSAMTWSMHESWYTILHSPRLHLHRMFNRRYWPLTSYWVFIHYICFRWCLLWRPIYCRWCRLWRLNRKIHISHDVWSTNCTADHNVSPPVLLTIDGVIFYDF